MAWTKQDTNKVWETFDEFAKLGYFDNLKKKEVSTVILDNKKFLSSLSVEQAVSWLYVNRGITITIEKLQETLKFSEDNKNM